VIRHSPGREHNPGNRIPRLRDRENAFSIRQGKGYPAVSYRVFDHTADLGIEVFGKTKREVYAGAALALFDLLTESGQVRKAQERTISAEGADEAELLVNFLREVLYAWNGGGFLAGECSIREMGRRRITTVLRGEAFDPTRHRIRQEIKAVTHHQASLRRTAAGWEARVVFDI